MVFQQEECAEMAFTYFYSETVQCYDYFQNWQLHIKLEAYSSEMETTGFNKCLEGSTYSDFICDYPIWKWQKYSSNQCKIINEPTNLNYC